MPFGLNIITILAKKGYQIDIYLSEYSSKSYEGIFPDNVTIKFIDQNYLWRNNVSLAYFLVTNYFKLMSFFKLRNKYDLIFGTGMAGITLGAILKRFNTRSKYIYLNDEFPIHNSNSIWVNSEIKNALYADIVSTPDESRFIPLCKQIPGLDKIPHYTLPNTPLIEDVQNIPKINWHEYFKIPTDKKLFLVAGGMYDAYQLPELLVSVKSWPENAILIKAFFEDPEDLELYRMMPFL